ncbi:MAG: HDOD domain-containing protein [Thermodesulfobacteriota bacterium]
MISMKDGGVLRRSIASGDYVVSGRKDEVVEAYLGTCVGLTLCDREAGVGGLIHLLLPEPTGIEKLWSPATYATTGLPVFLKSLLDAGASEERLEACMAGGALVGPLSELDLDLNIGGRTAEVVERFLSRQHIPLQTAETGGFFTCRIGLDLRTLKTEIDPLGVCFRKTEERWFARPTTEEIDETLERVRPIPQIAIKTLQMVRDSTHSFQEIAAEIRQDQVLSAKVIRLCRSALFGMKTGVNSIDRALVILGEKRFLQLVVSASVEEFYPLNGNGYSLCKGGLYKHALGMAVVSEALANFTGKAHSDVAYTAGLLHDIGKVVLDQFIARAFALFYRRTQMEGLNATEAETEIFGVTHNEVGGRLAERWALPEILTDVILHHHHPEQAEVHPDLVHIIYLADLIMSRFMAGQEIERLNTDSLGERLRTLGLTARQFPVILDGIPRMVFNSSMTHSN